MTHSVFYIKRASEINILWISFWHFYHIISSIYFWSETKIKFIFVMVSLPYSFIRLQNLVLQRQIVRKPKMRKFDISIKKIGIFSLLLFTFSWCPTSGYKKLSSFWLPLLNEIEEIDDYQIIGNPYGSRMVYPVRQLKEKKLLDSVRVRIYRHIYVFLQIKF